MNWRRSGDVCSFRRAVFEVASFYFSSSEAGGKGFQRGREMWRKVECGFGGFGPCV